MAFAGLKKPQERAGIITSCIYHLLMHSVDVIAYLKSATK